MPRFRALSGGDPTRSRTQIDPREERGNLVHGGRPCPQDATHKRDQVPEPRRRQSSFHVDPPVREPSGHTRLEVSGARRDERTPQPVGNIVQVLDGLDRRDRHDSDLGPWERPVGAVSPRLWVLLGGLQRPWSASRRCKAYGSSLSTPRLLQSQHCAVAV